VGHYDETSTWALVQLLAPADPNDRCGRASFCRGAKRLNEFLYQQWQRPDGRRYYLGEWHTHPHGGAMSNPMDKQTMFAIACDPHECCSEPILVLLSGDVSGPPQVSAFVFTCGKEIIPLILRKEKDGKQGGKKDVRTGILPEPR
jgi:hypothetical protein